MEVEEKVCPQCGGENYNSVPTKGKGLIAAYQCGDCNIVYMIVSKETYSAWRNGSADPRTAHAGDKRQAKPL